MIYGHSVEMWCDCCCWCVSFSRVVIDALSDWLNCNVARCIAPGRQYWNRACKRRNCKHFIWNTNLLNYFTISWQNLANGTASTHRERKSVAVFFFLLSVCVSMRLFVCWFACEFVAFAWQRIHTFDFYDVSSSWKSEHSIHSAALFRFLGALWAQKRSRLLP